MGFSFQFYLWYHFCLILSHPFSLCKSTLCSLLYALYYVGYTQLFYECHLIFPDRPAIYFKWVTPSLNGSTRLSDETTTGRMGWVLT